MAVRPVLTWFALIVGEAALAALVIGAFWYQEWQYALPTPRPTELRQPEIDEAIEIAELRQTAYSQQQTANSQQQTTKPIWLHFFNPSCPCSQFNLDHVRNLIAEFGSRVDVIAVLEATDPDALAKFQQLHLKCTAIVDHGGLIAKQTGVYATPQGVVLNEHHKLVYRGNYNLGRYCTESETEFVRLAIENCLAHRPPLTFPAAATVAIGCQLPADLAEAGR